jgi:hypothetical protein
MLDTSIHNTLLHEIARLNNTIQQLTLFHEKDMLNENYKNRVYVATINLKRAKIMLESIIEENEKS